ncbi:hypothetical protein KUTeg_007599 [Tegillarca granosa]|uniref:Uncharacterized protein n=1 Tax=Tegillarca granosa TaxID=220873 RepID=A0ABQ9FDS0_TEGGR|nr:hypothetical protein KUTeg_007599 [Tegillarca granosa]
MRCGATNLHVKFKQEINTSVENSSENQQFIEGVLSTFIVDDIYTITRNDQLIVRHGETLFLNHGVSQKQYISQEIRLLSRLTKTFCKLLSNKDGTVKDFLLP